MLERSDMHIYQNRSVDLIKSTLADRKGGTALWLDLGMGKSVSTATAVVDLQSDFTIGRCLIIAPKRVAVSTWPMELRNWHHLLGTRFSVVSGTAQQRKAALLQRADIHIISRDNVEWLVRMVGRSWPWDMVVIDESSSFKAQASVRWKALKKMLGRISHVVELSATPAPQGLQDLWAQFYLMDRGKRLGGDEKMFKARWFKVDGYNVVPRSHAKEEIYQRIDDVTIHLDADDYLDMPELIINKVMVQIPPKARKQYEDFKNSMVLHLDNEVDSHDPMMADIESGGVTVEAVNAAVLTGKLLQLANGAVYTDEFRNYTVLHDEKIDALKEIVETHAGYPVMVAYSFRSDLERILKAFPHAVVMDDDPETQVRWNNGEIEMLLTHPASSGHGLNLQRGSNILIWFGLSWSLELFLQLIGRLVRQGQLKDHVMMHLIIAEDTVDERLVKVLGRKEATQQDLLNAVREYVH